MPRKRGGRGGGRGGARGGGRAGSGEGSRVGSDGTVTTSKGGRFFHSKKKKSKTGPAVKHEYPEMNMFDAELPGKMTSLARRSGQSAEERKQSLFSRNLRSNPVIFVKAVQVYDPSAELFKKVSVIQVEKAPIKVICFDEVDSLINSVDLSEDEDEELSDVDSEEITHASVSEKLIQLANQDFAGEISVSNLSLNETPAEIDIPIDEIAPISKEQASVEIERMDIEPEQISESIVEEVEQVEEPIQIDAIENDAEVEENESEDEYNQDSEPDFIIDTDGDAKLIENDFDPAGIMSAISRPRKMHIDDLVYDPVLTIGNVSLTTSRDSKGNTTTQFVSKAYHNSASGFVDESEESDIDDSDLGGYGGYISNVMKSMREDNSDFDDDDEYESETNFDIMASQSDSDDEAASNLSDASEDGATNIEYGFLPEDYEFDVSQIAITNVRFGIMNQYYTRNLDLTGSPDEFSWVDEEDLFGYVLSNGVKEHRLRSFLKLVTNGLIDDAPKESAGDYSDVYISESEEENEVFEELDSDEDDGLEDFVSYTKSQQKSFLSTEDFEGTQSRRTKGKGKNKQLDLNRMDLETDLLISLQEQYQYMRQSKKNKKDKSAIAKLVTGTQKHDLRILYPFSMTIKDIKIEFELFLHDKSRDNLSFPPLNQDGNKIIIKMAKFYNMNMQKCQGNGLKRYIKVEKSKSTFRHLPKYNDIGHMVKKKSVYVRSDTKRSTAEILAIDGNSKKDAARGRSKSSHASHKDGDVIGADAPEIGHENFGRQMLVRMGWVTGEGLGVLGNKGISQPIMAVVKTTKLGLQ